MELLNRFGVYPSQVSFRPVVATGGSVVSPDPVIGGRTYRVHVFNSSDDFIVTDAGSEGAVEYLIVAGGGSGGVGANGTSGVSGSGGGAGGLVFREGQLISEGTFSVVVGQGGASESSYGSAAGNDGSDSTFYGDVAIGGGGGGTRGGPSGGISGRPGGSGGGGNHAYNSGGAALQPGSASGGFGNPGRSGFDGRGNDPDAGGGAGGVSPQLGFQDVACDGGPGLYFGDVFSEAYGESGWFAGGGGSGLNNNGRWGLGGIGGGGQANGSRTTPPSALGGTGGGGAGGANGSDGNTPSGAGGSGVVIIRYPLEAA